MSDVLIVGGGVIGLSLAYELAGQGARVRVVDAGQPGREASWAGAGILPPASATSDDPHQRLAALSNELHRRWSEELRFATGIDNGYRRCGAIYLARDEQAAARLAQFADHCGAEGIAAEALPLDAIGQREPNLQPTGPIRAAYRLPDECQIRNPRHLQALLAGCARQGVEITAGAAADDFEIHGNRIRAVRTSVGTLAADMVCLTAGPWTGALARRLGISPAIKPIRGQMVLLGTPGPMLGCIVNEGSRYLVPRGDGRILAGSTEEDVGFDRATTAGAVSDLLDFALSLVPALAAAKVERTWAGLRPATADGLPYLGRIPRTDNGFMAAGHFRSGLQLSTGTAVTMSQLMRDLPTDVDLTAFRVDLDGADDANDHHKRRGRREIRVQ